MLTIDEIRTKAGRLLAYHGLAERGWIFQFDRAKKRAGCCRFSKKRISLSQSFCKVAPEEEIVNTLLHEIAHALVGPGHSHDYTWRKKAKEIGCDGKVTHKIHFTEARYLLGCIQGCWEISRHRLNRKWLKSRRCAKCGATLGFKDFLAS